MTDQLRGAVASPLGRDEAGSGQLAEPLLGLCYSGRIVRVELVAGVS